MKERGIIFGAPMVRAILAGSKTQTRRLLKLRDGEDLDGISGAPNPPFRAFVSTGTQPTAYRQIKCPYGAIGDKLWVRETWATVGGVEGSPIVNVYRADGADYSDYESEDGDPFRWRPSIFMLREYSRITLEIADVRVERLQSITEEGAQAEGVLPAASTFTHGPPLSCRDVFARLWDSINGKRAPWSGNSYVWAVSFRRVTT